MDIDKKDIELYLSEVKEAVENGRYRLDRNARRQDNINLFLDYVINEAKVREIILSLTEMDFSGILSDFMYLARMSFFWREMEQRKKQFPCILNLINWMAAL